MTCQWNVGESWMTNWPDMAFPVALITLFATSWAILTFKTTAFSVWRRRLWRRWWKLTRTTNCWHVEPESEDILPFYSCHSDSYQQECDDQTPFYLSLSDTNVQQRTLSSNEHLSLAFSTHRSDVSFWHTQLASPVQYSGAPKTEMKTCSTHQTMLCLMNQCDINELNEQRIVIVFVKHV